MGRRFKKKIGNYEIVVTYKNGNVTVVVPRSVYCDAMSQYFEAEKAAGACFLRGNPRRLSELLDLIETAAQAATVADEYLEQLATEVLESRGFEEEA